MFEEKKNKQTNNKNNKQTLTDAMVWAPNIGGKN